MGQRYNLENDEQMLLNELWYCEAYEYEFKRKEDMYSRCAYLLQSNQDVLSLLLKSGADVNTKNDFGMSPLLCAYQLDRSKDACQLLI